MRRKPRVGLGVLVGLLMAMMTCLAASIIYLVRGPEAFAQNGTSFGEAIATYVVAGFLGGGIGGLLFPLTGWRAGAALVGAIAATPLYLGIALLVGEAVSAGVIGAVLVGGAVGYKLLPPPTKGVRSSPDAYTQQDP
jgi:hypothetical protein